MSQLSSWYSASWFEDAFGFEERSSYKTTKQKLMKQLSQDESKINGIGTGVLELPKVRDLIAGATRTTQAGKLKLLRGGCGGGERTVRVIRARVQSLIRDPRNAGAIFQVASNFNFLEGHGDPTGGVGYYIHDHTQGPAVVLATPAATAYRNYLVRFPSSSPSSSTTAGNRGQTKTRQIGELVLSDVRDELFKMMVSRQRRQSAKPNGGFATTTNNRNLFWTERNGYLTFTTEQLERTAAILRNSATNNGGGGEAAFEEMRVGTVVGAAVWDPIIPESDRGFRVNLILNSSPTVADSTAPRNHPDWEIVLRHFLHATYSSAFAFADRMRRPIFLTRVGGGVFGVPKRMIDETIANMCIEYPRVAATMVDY